MRLDGERVIGVAASLVGLAAIVEGLRLTEYTFTGGPGTRVLPVALGVIVGALGLSVAVRPSGAAAQGRATDAGSRVRVAGTLAGVLAYVLVFERLGFVLSTATFLTLLLWSYGERRWPVLAAVALGGTGVTYAVFGLWLKVPLPPGLLGP